LFVIILKELFILTIITDEVSRKKKRSLIGFLVSLIFPLWFCIYLAIYRPITTVPVKFFFELDSGTVLAYTGHLVSPDLILRYFIINVISIVFVFISLVLFTIFLIRFIKLTRLVKSAEDPTINQEDIAHQTLSTEPKSRMTALLLCLFFGNFGAHRFLRYPNKKCCSLAPYLWFVQHR